MKKGKRNFRDKFRAVLINYVFQIVLRRQVKQIIEQKCLSLVCFCVMSFIKKCVTSMFLFLERTKERKPSS